MRLSATAVEQFRLVMQTDWAKEEDLLASLRGEQVETWQMRAGTAWHSLLEAEELPPADNGLIAVNEWLFRHEDAALARAMLPAGGVYECKVTMDLAVDGEPVVLVGKVDHLLGLAIHDRKTKFSAPDLKHYDNSLQWRIYLLLLEASYFQYDIFHFSEPDNAGILTLKDTIGTRQWPYPGMEADVRFWITEFVRWLRSKNLTPAPHRRDAA